jgi:hypothetical protein
LRHGPYNSPKGREKAEHVPGKDRRLDSIWVAAGPRRHRGVNIKRNPLNQTREWLQPWLQLRKTGLDGLGQKCWSEVCAG